MKNIKRTTIIRYLNLSLWMQAVIILSCLTIAVPFKTWAQNAEPSEHLTRLLKPGTSTVYYFNYPTVNSTGEPIVLSSALIAWTPNDRQEGDSIESVHIYSHATIGADEERPTSTGFSKEQMVLQSMPKRNYIYEGDPAANYIGHCIIIAPDYEGFGVTKDLPHPYLSQRLTARQVLDAVNYGLELYHKQMEQDTPDELLLPLKNDWRMFAIGYSQGGAVTLAFQRLIEEEGLSEQLHFYGSVCGDGPYDLIETLHYYFEDDGTSYGVKTDHRKNMSTYPVVVPLIIKGMYSTHPAMAKYRIEDYLSQQLIDTNVLGWIDSKQYTTSEMSKMWYDQVKSGLTASDRSYTPEQMAELFSTPQEDKVAGHLEKMFTPATFDYLSNADSMSVVPTNPTTAQQALHLALAENSVATGWEPQHRIQFFHSHADMVVPFGNYLAFRDAHPDTENTIYRIDDPFLESDHMTAAVIFFLNLCPNSTYASDFQWICEGVISTGIDAKNFADAQRRTSDEDNWYTLDGRCLSSRPTTNGIYIHNQKKVVIK
ncbi:MAG: hypothetical protein J6W52_08455 [Bacteroidaceae bacterium]|nr:hypothetical protein [Bacteroidaceae bacterium]